MIRNMLASLIMLVMGMQMSMAQGLSAIDIAFAFGGTVSNSERGLQRVAPTPKLLGTVEMEATEGEWIQIPLVAGLRLGIQFLGRGGGGRICGMMCRITSSRTSGYRSTNGFGIRMDYEINPSPTRLHFHIGRFSQGRDWGGHRPWTNPFRRY